MKKIKEFQKFVNENYEETNEAEKWISDAIKRPGSLRRKLHKGKEDKISKSEIESEISALKKKDKDKEKPGLQLSDKDQRKHKQLVLAKTLREFK